MPRVYMYPGICLVAIDGIMQKETQRADCRIGEKVARVYVRWAVPTDGAEWGGAYAVGRQFLVHLYATDGLSLDAGPVIFAAQMKCKWFAEGQVAPHKLVVARAIFEAPHETVVRTPGEPGPEYWGLK